MIVAKKFIKWPESQIDEIVARWFIAKGIKDFDVRSYTIRRDASGSCWIEVEMWFDPEPLTEVPGIDKSEPEFLPKE